MSIKNNKNICLVYIYMEIFTGDKITLLYSVYYYIPGIKNIVLFSGIIFVILYIYIYIYIYIYTLYIIYTL